MAKRKTSSASGDQAPYRALVVFVDLRGFSEWSTSIEAHGITRDLLREFHDLLRAQFPGFTVKPLGDGAMLVCPEPPFSDPREVKAALSKLTGQLVAANRAARLNFRSRQAITGHRCDLELGWGIVRGPVIPLDDGDVVGATVNKAARLCDLARPAGVVIDRVNFPDVDPFLDPEPDRDDEERAQVFPQIYRLDKPKGQVEVWVTAPIFHQFRTRERLREAPEVHVAGMALRRRPNGDRELLVAKRSPSRHLFPGLWEGCGGQLRAGESFEEGLLRHFRAEMGLTVAVLDVPPVTYAIREPDKQVIPGLRFLCRHVEGTPSSPNHSAVRWVAESDFRALPRSDFPPGLHDQILTLLDHPAAAV